MQDIAERELTYMEMIRREPRVGRLGGLGAFGQGFRVEGLEGFEGLGFKVVEFPACLGLRVFFGFAATRLGSLMPYFRNRGSGLRSSGPNSLSQIHMNPVRVQALGPAQRASTPGC